jgi:hypothetical protein
MSYRFAPDVEAADEAFWQRQEARKRGLLGQPCCTQSNMSWAMMDVPGEFAVVVHGEFDCLNCFHHHLGPSPHRFFSTRLSDHQITTGDTQRPLGHLLRLIVKERAPKAIVVLGTCPVEVIGDRFEVVAEAVAAETGTPILALHTSGLKLSSLTDCQDWLFDSLASLPQGEAVDQGWYARASDAAMDVVLSDATLSVDRSHALHARLAALPPPASAGRERRLNLVGLPEPDLEPVEVLGDLGLTVNGFYPHGASLEAWRSIGRAEATFAVDVDVWPRFARRLTEDHRQDLASVALPIGVGATERFYRTVAARFGAEDRVAAALGERLERARADVAAFRATHGGARLGMAIRMLNTFQVDRIAQEGLGELEHLRECGFAVTLLVQGPAEEGPRFEARLRDRGVDVPVRTFPGPFGLGEALASGGYDAALVPDSSRNTARRAGLPMISSRSLRPWLSGVGPNLRVLADLVDQARGGTR